MTALLSHVCSPYEALCGDAWRALPSRVRALHEAGFAVGALQVEGATHVIARCIARWLRLPRASASMRVELAIERAGVFWTWRRTFADVQLITAQHARGDLLYERFGMIELAFEVVVRSDGFSYVQRHAALRWGWLPLRLPRWLAPIAQGEVAAVEEGVAVDVRIRLPMIGTLLRYRGVMRSGGAR